MTHNLENVGTYDDMQQQINGGDIEILLLPKAQNVGIINGQKALENLSILVQRAKHALENGFYIEFISLKIQFIEFYLKIFWVTKHPDNLILDENNKKFFGNIINECERFGFDPDLTNKIKNFNETRIKAIHKYLMGGTGEEELKSFSLTYSKLGNEIFEYVINECGTIINDVSNIPQDVGTLFITRQKGIN